MRDWTPYKSETITNINLLDPVHTIAGQQYRHSEIIDIYNYWQSICDRQDVMMTLGQVMRKIDDPEHNRARFYAENCSRLNEKWYSKLREEWRPKQEKILGSHHAKLVDFIAKDLQAEYIAFLEAINEENKEYDDGDEYYE